MHQFENSFLFIDSHTRNTTFIQQLTVMLLKYLLSFVSVFAATATAYDFPKDLPNGNYSVLVSQKCKIYSIQPLLDNLYLLSHNQTRTDVTRVLSSSKSNLNADQLRKCIPPSPRRRPILPKSRTRNQHRRDLHLPTRPPRWRL